MFHDKLKPKTQTGGELLSSPNNLTAGTSGESGDRAYWDARQAALGISTNGEALLPDEIVFCERLRKQYPDQSLDTVLEWLKQGQIGERGVRDAEYDFVWMAYDGQKWELKSSITQRYESIKQRLKDDLAKGKTRFIIDLGVGELTDELRRQLSTYASKRSISGMAVLSNDGATLTFIA